MAGKRSIWMISSSVSLLSVFAALSACSSGVKSAPQEAGGGLELTKIADIPFLRRGQGLDGFLDYEYGVLYLADDFSGKVGRVPWGSREQPSWTILDQSDCPSRIHIGESHR